MLGCLSFLRLITTSTLRNIENFKNLITTRVDEVSFPYASLPSKLSRRFVLIGTTNRNQFLVDSTGNRRFVPFEIGANFLDSLASTELKNVTVCGLLLFRLTVTVSTYEFNSGEIAADC